MRIQGTIPELPAGQDEGGLLPSYWWVKEPEGFRDWLDSMRLLRPLGGVSSGNIITMHTDGDGLFEDLWRAIDGARERVWLETFIYEPDEIGQITLSKLVEAAKRPGCEVILMYDYVGSYALKSSFLQPLRDAGGLVVPFNPIWPWQRIGPLKFRNHRKVVVVDDSCAFCGGMNIGADYAGPRLGTNRFMDVHLRISGPAIGHFAVLFEESLRESGARAGRAVRDHRFRGWLAKHKRWLGPEEAWQLQVLGSNGFGKRRAIQRALRYALRRSRKYCHITTPYFVPPPMLARAIIKAAHRGVDVCIITAGDTEAPLARMAAHHIYGRFLRAGVKIFEHFGQTLHAKTVNVDGIYASVGSFNLDTWSHRNLEANVTALDPLLSADVERFFQMALAGSKRVESENVDSRSALGRAFDWLAYVLMH